MWRGIKPIVPIGFVPGYATIALERSFHSETMNGELIKAGP
jgi:hypothetical protein